MPSYSLDPDNHSTDLTQNLFLYILGYDFDIKNRFDHAFILAKTKNNLEAYEPLYFRLLRRLSNLSSKVDKFDVYDDHNGARMLFCQHVIGVSHKVYAAVSLLKEIFVREAQQKRLVRQAFREISPGPGMKVLQKGQEVQVASMFSPGQEITFRHEKWRS